MRFRATLSFRNFKVMVTEHLMAGLAGNSEFCFPQTKSRGTLMIEPGKTKLTVSLGPIKCLVTPGEGDISDTTS